MPPSKDYTKYIFCGKKQGKSRLVLSVLTKHSAANPSMTYDDLKEEDIIQIKDCKVVVSTEWNYQNIQNFINAARKLGHEIDIVK